MNGRVIAALVLRYSLLYLRSWIRSIELIFWPTLELLLWGFLSVFIQGQTEGDFPYFAKFLIGAMIFWDVLFRAQQGVAISFLEDVWTRNLLNLFVAPIRLSEYLSATCIIGCLRVAVTVALLALFAQALYAFNLFEFEWKLIPFFGNLLLFGWSLGMISTAFILRWGLAAESLAWAVPFLIQPISAVFYPVSVLPVPLQTVAWLLPSTYVFEGMRGVISTGEMQWNSLLISILLNAAFLIFSSGFFAFMFNVARNKGLLVKIASE